MYIKRPTKIQNNLTGLRNHRKNIKKYWVEYETVE